jgi:hypothetical protein
LWELSKEFNLDNGSKSEVKAAFYASKCAALKYNEIGNKLKIGFEFSILF